MEKKQVSIVRFCLQDLALDAVQKVMVKHEGADPEIDIKKYAKVEKLPGGSLDDCRYTFPPPKAGSPSRSCFLQKICHST